MGNAAALLLVARAVVTTSSRVMVFWLCKVCGPSVSATPRRWHGGTYAAVLSEVADGDGDSGVRLATLVMRFKDGVESSALTMSDCGEKPRVRSMQK